MGAAAPDLLDVILNLARFHREHEKFYARAPLEQALSLQRWSVVLQALADRWQAIDPLREPSRNRYAGCEDLNDTAAIDISGILFLEGESEPVELTRMKRELSTMAGDFGTSGAWLAEAMVSSWETAEALLPLPQLAGLLGERHRIIANDWQAAGLSRLVAQLLERAVDVLAQVDFTPAALRADLADSRSAPAYLFSASELINRAADLVAESAVLVHDNERRWRVFRARVAAVAEEVAARG